MTIMYAIPTLVSFAVEGGGEPASRTARDFFDRRCRQIVRISCVMRGGTATAQGRVAVHSREATGTLSHRAPWAVSQITAFTQRVEEQDEEGLTS
jgi:hypothetical protein